MRTSRRSMTPGTKSPVREAGPRHGVLELTGNDDSTEEDHARLEQGLEDTRTLDAATHEHQPDTEHGPARQADERLGEEAQRDRTIQTYQTENSDLEESCLPCFQA